MYIRKTKSGYVAEIYVSGVRRSKSFPLRRDAVQWATTEEIAIRSQQSVCPNCESLIKMQDEKCETYHASFEELSAWRSKPI